MNIVLFYVLFLLDLTYSVAQQASPGFSPLFSPYQNGRSPFNAYQPQRQPANPYQQPYLARLEDQQYLRPYLSNSHQSSGFPSSRYPSSEFYYQPLTYTTASPSVNIDSLRQQYQIQKPTVFRQQNIIPYALQQDSLAVDNESQRIPEQSAINGNPAVDSVRQVFKPDTFLPSPSDYTSSSEEDNYDERDPQAYYTDTSSDRRQYQQKQQRPLPTRTRVASAPKVSNQDDHTTSDESVRRKPNSFQKNVFKNSSVLVVQRRRTTTAAPTTPGDFVKLHSPASRGNSPRRIANTPSRRQNVPVGSLQSFSAKRDRQRFRENIDETDKEIDDQKYIIEKIKDSQDNEDKLAEEDVIADLTDRKTLQLTAESITSADAFSNLPFEIVEKTKKIPTTNAPDKEEISLTESIITKFLNTTPSPESTNSTESVVIVASVQTSRSITGPRSSLFSVYKSKTNSDKNENVQTTTKQPETLFSFDQPTHVLPTVPSGNASALSHEGTLSKIHLIDRLDLVQSELSSHLLSRIKSDQGQHNLENKKKVLESDTLLGVLGDKSTEIPLFTTTSTSTNSDQSLSSTTQSPTETVTSTTSTSTSTVAPRIVIKKLHVPGSYNLRSTTTAATTPSSSTNSYISKLFNKAKIQDVSSFLPPDFKIEETTKSMPSIKTTTPYTTVATSPNVFKTYAHLFDNVPTEDVSKFLPKGYKIEEAPIKLVETTTLSTTSTTKEPLTTVVSKVTAEKNKFSNLFANIKFDDVNAFLPPGFKRRPEVTTERKEMITTTSTELPKTTSSVQNQTSENPFSSILGKIKFDDVAAFLPPGYKLTETTEKSINLTTKDIPLSEVSDVTPSNAILNQSSAGLFPKKSLFDTILIDDISAFLPPGFKVTTNGPIISASPSPIFNPEELTTTTTSKPRVVFPTRLGGGSKPRVSTSGPKLQGPPKVAITIQSGWPVRKTTAFTGWPSPPTTPSTPRPTTPSTVATSSIPEVNRSPSSTLPPLTGPPTTTPPPPRPTTPGMCGEQCRLASTIRIVDGAIWGPELLDPHTVEWKKLASKIAEQLNSLYKSGPLRQWYDSVKIDAFSKGSILVDYFVILKEVKETITTQEVRRLFNESLKGVSKLGQFSIDQKFTDFIVVPAKTEIPVASEEYELLPQWAIAMIVVGFVSLLFVVGFGVTVLLNRHRKSTRRQVNPLTPYSLEAIHELHKAQSLTGAEEFWNSRLQTEKFNHKSPGMYDSWRSSWSVSPYDNPQRRRLPDYNTGL